VLWLGSLLLGFRVCTGLWSRVCSTAVGRATTRRRQSIIAKWGLGQLRAPRCEPAPARAQAHPDFSFQIADVVLHLERASAAAATAALAAVATFRSETAASREAAGEGGARGAAPSSDRRPRPGHPDRAGPGGGGAPSAASRAADGVALATFTECTAAVVGEVVALRGGRLLVRWADGSEALLGPDKARPGRLLTSANFYVQYMGAVCNSQLPSQYLIGRHNVKGKNGARVVAARGGRHTTRGGVSLPKQHSVRGSIVVGRCRRRSPHHAAAPGPVAASCSVGTAGRHHSRCRARCSC